MNSSFRSATASFLAITLSFASLTACSSEKKVSADSASPAAGNPPAAAAANPPAGTPAQPVAAQNAAAQAPPDQQAAVGQDALNAPQPNQPPPTLMSNADLVAPIALYPDALLAQVLASATNPQEVLDAGNWLIQNQNLKGDAAVTAAERAGFTPSVQYLVNFPQVVDQMCQQIDWTTQLGQAFKADPKGVLEAVQLRRREAQKMGNLGTTPQMVVDTKTDNGQQIIEIQPASPTVVYVPQYNPVTVYTTPAPPQTVVVQQGVSTGTAVGIGLLSFGVGMAVGALISRPNYYPYPSWGYGGMYYGGRPYYPPPYRPVYPGYRPAYGYHPPPNYHWNQYNRQTNITVNNNNYYNNFNKNQYNQYNKNQINSNNRPGNPNQLPANNRPGNQYPNNANRPNNQLPATRPATANNNQANQGNLQGKYQGQRPNTNATQKPGSGMANANPANAGQRPTTANRPTTGNAAAGGNRPNTGAGSANTMNRPNTSGTGNRPNTGAGNTASRPANQTMQRPTTGQAASTQSRPANQTMQRPAGGNAAAKPAGRPAGNTAAPKGGPAGGGKPQGGAKPTGRPQKPQ